MKAPRKRVDSQPASSSDGSVRMVSVAELPTRSGNFRAIAFTADARGDEHIAFVRGDVRGRSRVPTRIHSECLTGDVIGSLRCDCRDQLQAALDALGGMPHGVLLYMRQEGRGIGLTNKIRAYALQDGGHDTVEANHMLGFGDDERDYGVAAQMLAALGVRSVRLMTNNPRKITGLEQAGIKVAGRMPLVMPANRHNAHYLMTKQKRSGHWLGIADRPRSTPEALAEPAERASA